WRGAGPDQTFIATSMFLGALTVTAVSFWYTHVLARKPGTNFLYTQVIFDALLVTALVHITGGGESNFAWLYILVISSGALLLPLPGGVLIGAFASMLYFADIVWGHAETFSGAVVLQISLFALVALATGQLGDRLRRAGLALGVVETELRRLRLDTTEILGSIATGVLTIDSAGRMIYMNAAAEHLLGLNANQWVGAPILVAVESVAPGFGTLLRRSLEERLTLDRYKTTARRNEEEVVLGVSTTVREGEGEIASSVTAIFQDITDLERLAELDRRNERLEAVAELSASMAHEIKNPLASIRSAVEQFTNPDLLVDDRALLVRMVVNESDRLSRLLSEFIDFSRLKMGEIERVDLAAIVREAVALARQHPAGEGVEIRESGTDTPLHIPGDADLLHRALFNLVLNAVQFSEPGGQVVVDVRARAGSAKLLGSGISAPVRVSIRDSGPGIARGDVQRVFDPFYTTRRGGSGLGLSVVHRAVEAHQGVILVESEPG
ncbi:MAG: ATP-binding protein, partial [Gemmatimonadota bacterium]